MKHRESLLAVLWIGGVSVTAHLLYSTLGFNPTDDGFTLAYSRRLILGQIPHLDFISIRPCLSPALHVPEVLFGGAYTYWISRFVFFLQWAVVAWFATGFIIRGLGLALRSGERFALALITFVFCCHSFPPMVWHTVDGIFLSVLGLHFRSRPAVRRAWPAYLLFGAAYLCKQSFIFVAPALLVLFGDWRKWRCLAATALPGVFYLVILVATGGLGDGLEQMLSQNDFFTYAVRSYLRIPVFAGIGAGFAAAGLLSASGSAAAPGRRSTARWFGSAIVAAAFLLAAAALYEGRQLGVQLGLFGMVCGAIVRMVSGSPRERFSRIRTGAVLIVLAWSASLSIGYNTPAFVSGMLLVFLLGLVLRSLPAEGMRLRPLLSVVAVLAAVIAFHHTRTHHIYRERPASELTKTLGDVLPGGKLIRTNPNTYEFLVDLDRAIDEVDSEGLGYAIVPDLAGYWVQAKEANPLPIDWPQGIELNTPALFDRVTRSIEDGRPHQAVLLQKFGAEALDRGFLELRIVEDEWFHTVVRYVRNHLDRTGETECFDIYR